MPAGAVFLCAASAASPQARAILTALPAVAPATAQAQQDAADTCNGDGEATRSVCRQARADWASGEPTAGQDPVSSPSPGPSAALAVLGPLVTATELSIPDTANLSIEAGVNLLTACGEVEEGSRWWQGDLYLWLERRYGRDMLSDHLGADVYERVRPYIWTSERCPPDIRQPSLTWSHHRAVGACKAEGERLDWLLQAVNEGWTVRQLQAAMRGTEDTPAKRVNKDAVIARAHDRIGQTWTVEDYEAVRAAMGIED